VKYIVKHHTGDGDIELIGTLKDAMQEADKGIAYTQNDIAIYRESGKIAALRPWYGVSFNPDETEETKDEIIDFGAFGYFGAWAIL